jgi:hypothetical protein
MPKSLAPEVLALIPDGIQEFIPRCVVCTSAVPSNRRSGITRHTCSPPCQKVWTLFRGYLLSTRKCVACLHPATPGERAEYREWRRSRGDLRQKKGRPTGQKNLDKALAVSGTP